MYLCMCVCVLYFYIYKSSADLAVCQHTPTLRVCQFHSLPGHWLEVCVRMDCQTSNWLDLGLALKSYWTKTSQSTLHTLHTHTHTQKN